MAAKWRGTWDMTAERVAFCMFTLCRPPHPVASSALAYFWPVALQPIRASVPPMNMLPIPATRDNSDICITLQRTSAALRLLDLSSGASFAAGKSTFQADGFHASHGACRGGGGS